MGRLMSRRHNSCQKWCHLRVSLMVEGVDRCSMPPLCGCSTQSSALVSWPSHAARCADHGCIEHAPIWAGSNQPLVLTCWYSTKSSAVAGAMKHVVDGACVKRRCVLAPAGQPWLTHAPWSMCQAALVGCWTCVYRFHVVTNQPSQLPVTSELVNWDPRLWLADWCHWWVAE